MSLLTLLMTSIQITYQFIQCLFTVTLFLNVGETQWVKICSLYEVASSFGGQGPGEVIIL